MCPVQPVDVRSDGRRVLTPEGEHPHRDGGVRRGGQQVSGVVEYAATVESRDPQRGEAEFVELGRRFPDFGTIGRAKFHAPDPDTAEQRTDRWIGGHRRTSFVGCRDPR